MASARLDPDDLHQMTLSELAELDDGVITGLVDGLVGRCDSGDRLWQADPPALGGQEIR